MADSISSMQRYAANDCVEAGHLCFAGMVGRYQNFGALNLKRISLGKRRLYQKLYLAMKESDKTIPYITRFISCWTKSRKQYF